ncbi:CRISPR-associated endonuclease Cas3'' [Streptomyces sp. NPDC006384]|uniref:CRISPR-associated endonuclease Cas3'' n=1 Tax=Streptomyces sp. NPDC006384 TaxID=3364745 RepID=UPI0036B5FE1D
MTNQQGIAVPCACPDPRLWGKERGLERAYPVMCHLLDVAAVFGVLWDVLLSAAARERFAEQLALDVKDCRAVLSFWAGLHDLGKITPVFQAQVPSLFDKVRTDAAYLFAPGAERERGFRHEMATHWSLASLLAEEGYPTRRGTTGVGGAKAPAAHWVGQLLGGHHGVFGAKVPAAQLRLPSQYQPGLGEAGWAEQRRLHFEELRRVTGGEAVPGGVLSADMAVVLTGLVVTADWLASQIGAIKQVRPADGAWQGTPAQVDAHWQRTSAAASALVAEAQLGRATFEAESFGEMFPFSPNPLQGDLVEHLPGLVAEGGAGLVLMTAPTGDGKTEAALYAASVLGPAAGARGMYVALPTMATADAMYKRVRKFAESSLGGERALTLLHSMAWLNPLYGQAAQDAAATAVGRGQAGEVSADAATAVTADAWLRGARHGFLAPLSVGTIDQALRGVLPLRYNVLPLFGLHEKVFVVDEAHAYGPWMHKLLLTLLEWLGAMRSPVVLLSATLTGSTAASLVNAYRRGAGFLEPAAIAPCYPGWLYASAVTGEVSAPRPTSSGRPRTLDVRVRRVAWDVAVKPTDPPQAGGRREALREELRPVAEAGGTALVCCTTVPEAQATYRDLCAAFPDLAGQEGGIRLLHSRFPANDRQRITADCEAAYGKPRADQPPTVRPASILVATQVVEQSLDLDFDLVVSDLAPLAQLLQRAGRGRRHRRGPGGRPVWAQAEDRPKLVVLDPFRRPQKSDKPATWGSVYDASLLIRTSLLLTERAADGIVVPDGVQELVDAVYAPDFVDGLDAAVERELKSLDVERLASEMAETDLAAMVGISGPGNIEGQLHLISRRLEGVTEELLTTRLGADTGRVLCAYVQEDGSLTLARDGSGGPVPGLDGRPLSRDDVAAVAAHTAPVPGKWVREGADAERDHPAPWKKISTLRDVVLLPMREVKDGLWTCPRGAHTIGVSAAGLEQF